MMKKRRHNPRQRGFALFLVVLIVALVAVAGGTLLDFVEVDLIVTGVNRQTKIAHATSVGGVLETIADETLTVPNLPIDPTATPVFDYADDSVTPTRNPGGVGGPPTAMNENNSAFTRFVGTTLQESYSSDVRMVSVGLAEDTSVNAGRAVYYEVRALSNVADGSASKETRAAVYRYAAGAAIGQILDNAVGIHAR